MGAAAELLCRGDRAILATTHAKETVIASIVERFPGLRLAVTSGADGGRPYARGECNP